MCSETGAERADSDKHERMSKELLLLPLLVDELATEDEHVSSGGNELVVGECDYRKENIPCEEMTLSVSVMSL